MAWLGRDNKLKHYIPVDLPAPRLPHDMCFSENFAILNDFPMFWPQAALDAGFYVPVFDKNIPSRFAIIPRHGKPEEIKWFEAGVNLCTPLHERL